MNSLEFLPTSDGLVAVTESPDGEIHTFDMTWEQFERLRLALGRDGQ